MGRSENNAELLKVFSKRLRELMLEKNISSADLSRMLNVNKSTVSFWVNAKTFPDQNNIDCISNILQVSSDYLLGRTNINDSSNIKNIIDIDGWSSVPVYKQISCGEGCLCDDEIIDYVAVPANIIRSKECFAIPANGDSMINIGINEGDILIFRKDDVYDNNDVVAVCIDSEEIALCKRIKKVDKNSVVLISENSKYPPMLITKDKRMRVLGKLVYSIKKF